MPGNRKIVPKKECAEETPNTSKKSCVWTLNERKALVTAIRTYGFGNIGKIAEVVKTRTCSDIEMFINQWKNRLKGRLPAILSQVQAVTEEVNKKKKPRKKKRSESQDSKASMPLELWIHTVKNLVQSRFRTNDYSDIFENIFRSAANNVSHVEPTTSGQPNFKDIYTYFAALLCGSVSPPPLSSTDSVLVVYLMSQLSDFVRQGSWPQEKAFLKDAHLPTEFLCFESDSAVPDVGPVVLPAGETTKRVVISSQLNSNLNLHKKIQENLNPLCIPMDLLKKEQKEVEKHFASV